MVIGYYSLLLWQLIFNQNTRRMKKLVIQTICLLFVCLGSVHAQQEYLLNSPDGKLNLKIELGTEISWSLDYGHTSVLAPSCLSMTLETGEVLGHNPKVKKASRRSVENTFSTPFYKKDSVQDTYNELTLNCAGNYSIQFRAYDDGAAYRFITNRKTGFTVKDELAEFNFKADYKAYIPYINDNRGGDYYSFSFESYYDVQPISKIYPDSLAITPLLVELENGIKATIMENGLENYAGMFLVSNSEQKYGIKGAFAPEILDGYWGGHMEMNYVSTKRAGHIAKSAGKQKFPWRTVVVSSNDIELLDNDMAQRLASPSRIDDISWIRPGKVAWDWWNTTNLSGVNFKAGMNTDTYKYFIDFASANGIEYVIIDCGWSGSVDDWKGETLMHCNPAINLKEIIAHGNNKGVGVILWASWALCDTEKDIAFPHYAKMGIKGFKVDFLDRDDQKMMQSMWSIVKTAADNHLLIDLHGMKPTGIQRTYPNVVNFEGVKGLENCKWAAMDGENSREDFLAYDVTIPYIRMLAGPLDYTPGAMTNKIRKYFRPVNDHPMSQGTRVHQMAMYTVYEAPLQMLADSPTAYMKNQECTDFIAQVPTVFDETKALDGKVGEYVSIARRKGSHWWIGAMTNWDKRDMQIDFSFLPVNQTFVAEIFCDGINSDVEATDYRKEVINVNNSTVLTAHLYPGGGWTARIYPADE